MPQEDFDKLLGLILSKVVVVPDGELLPHKAEALKIVKDIDLDDVLFIACALAYPDSVVWSDDKQLKKQPRVKILNTKEVIASIDG